jgi:uncharacterized protein YjbI with pentapeptide repeats
VVDADTDDFAELATLMGLDLKTDFVGADLNKVDLQNANLSRANLYGAILSGAIVLDTRFGFIPGLSAEMIEGLKKRGGDF